MTVTTHSVNLGIKLSLIKLQPVICIFPLSKHFVSTNYQPRQYNASYNMAFMSHVHTWVSKPFPIWIYLIAY